MALALWSNFVYQVLQHFIEAQVPQDLSRHKQLVMAACFVRQFICSVISLHSVTARAVRPQQFSKVDVNHWHARLSLSFHFSLLVSKFIESLRVYVFVSRLFVCRSSSVCLPVCLSLSLSQSPPLSYYNARRSAVTGHLLSNFMKGRQIFVLN